MDIVSSYEGTITMTYQQMWEVHKAISARVVKFALDGNSDSFEVELLLGVAEMLGAHTATAVEEYEAKVARVEAAQLDNDEALRKFLES